MDAWEDDVQEPKGLENDRLAGVVRTLTESKDGLFFLRWLIGESRALKSAYPADHVRCAFIEGKRELGVRLVMLAQQAHVAGRLFDEQM